MDDTLDAQIFMILKSNNKITQKKIATNLGISIASVKRIMKKLVENGIIERKGGKRFGYWEFLK